MDSALLGDTVRFSGPVGTGFPDDRRSAAIIIPPYFIRYRGWIPGLIYFALVGSIVFYNLAPALLP